MGSNNQWDAEEIFQKYLHDYLVKNNMHKTAEVFAKEANADVCAVVSAIDSPQGFLAEWWSIFHDVYFHLQPRPVEACQNVSTKGKQVTGTNSQGPCSEASNCGFTPQSSVHDCDNMIAQLSPNACEGATQKRLTKKIDSNSQNSTETPSGSKLAGSGPSNSQRNPRKQAQQRQDKKRVASLGSTPMVSSTFAEPKTIGSETTLYSAPLRGWPLIGANQVPPRVGNQVLNSYLQSANTQKQADMPMSQSQQEMYAQFLANTTSKALSSFPLTSDMDILLRNGIERINGQDGRGEKRGFDESIEMLLSQHDDHADYTNAPCTLKHPSISSEKDGHTGNSLVEIGSLHASKGKVFSCNFSPNGNFLACAGLDKKVLLWNMNNMEYYSSLETHSHLITDVRFHPSSKYFATSSFDKTVQVWDASESHKSLFTLSGHADHVMSLDFHPRKMDLLCSSDSNNEFRLWDIKGYSCLRVSKGATRQVRFQPQLGRLLATASGNVVNIFNVETGDFEFVLKGHQCEVRCVCWDVTGTYLASVSEESVRLWSIVSDGRCIYEFKSTGHNFQSCTFHPERPLLVIIGSYQFLCLWNPTQSNTIDTIQAHNGLIASLATSTSAGLIASASHDQSVKLWR